MSEKMFHYAIAGFKVGGTQCGKGPCRGAGPAHPEPVACLLSHTLICLWLYLARKAARQARCFPEEERERLEASMALGQRDEAGGPTA